MNLRKRYTQSENCKCLFSTGTNVNIMAAHGNDILFCRCKCTGITGFTHAIYMYGIAIRTIADSNYIGVTRASYPLKSQTIALFVEHLVEGNNIELIDDPHYSPFVIEAHIGQIFNIIKSLLHIVLYQIKSSKNRSSESEYFLSVFGNI